MERAHVVLIDKIVIKFTVSFKKWLKSLQVVAKTGGRGSQGIEFQQKTCQIFFPLLLFNILPLLGI